MTKTDSVNCSSSQCKAAVLNSVTIFIFSGTLFFLLTNGIPFIQLGFAHEFSKGVCVKLTRISTGVLFAWISALYFTFPKRFQELRLIQNLRGLLEHSFWKVIAGLFALYALGPIAVGWMRHAALETRAFDLGIFSQALWNTAHGHFLYSSLKNGICLLGDHVSPLLVFLTPVYQLWPDPRVLIVIQSLFGAASLFAVANIAEQKTKSRAVAFFFALLFFFYLPTRNALREDFHPEVLIDAVIFLSFIFLESGKRISFLVSLLIIAMAKENMLAVTFALGFYSAVFKKWRWTGAAVMVGSAVIFIFETQWLVPHLTQKTYYYQSYYKQLFLSSPGNSLGLLFGRNAMKYIARIFGPFLFLSLFHPPTLLLTLPILLQNLLSNNPLTRSLGYHYTVGLSPFVFISAILGFENLCRKFKFLSQQKVFFAAVLLIVQLFNSGTSEYYSFWQNLQRRSPHRDKIRRTLNAIPSDVSVLTHNVFIPQLANRKEVYQFSDTGAPTKAQLAESVRADKVIFDAAFMESGSQNVAEIISSLKGKNYHIEFQEDGFYILSK